MTDLEKMKSTFINMGIDFTESKIQAEQVRTHYGDEVLKCDFCIKLNQGIGYNYFECIFYFLKGKYINHGCWE